MLAFNITNLPWKFTANTKLAHCGFSYLVHSFIPKDNIFKNILWFKPTLGLKTSLEIQEYKVHLFTLEILCQYQTCDSKPILGLNTRLEITNKKVH